MPLTPEEAQELAELRQYFAAKSPQPEQPEPAPWTRLAQQTANIPFHIARGLVNGGQGLLRATTGIEGDENSAYNVALFHPDAPRSTGEALADVVPGIAATVATAMIPGGIVARGASLLGASPAVASVAGDVAGGAFLGLAEPNGHPAATGAEFGLIGAAGKLPIPGAAKALLNLAIPVGGQLLRGENPLEQQQLINSFANMAVPALMGHYAAPRTRTVEAPSVGAVAPVAPPEAPRTLMRTLPPDEAAAILAGSPPVSPRAAVEPGAEPPIPLAPTGVPDYVPDDVDPARRRSLFDEQTPYEKAQALRQEQGDEAAAASVGLTPEHVNDFLFGKNETGINPQGMGHDGLTLEIANRMHLDASQSQRELFHGGQTDLSKTGFSDKGPKRGFLGKAYLFEDEGLAQKYALGGGIDSTLTPEEYREMAADRGVTPFVTKAVLNSSKLLDVTSRDSAPKVRELFDNRKHAEQVIGRTSLDAERALSEAEENKGARLSDDEFWDVAEKALGESFIEHDNASLSDSPFLAAGLQTGLLEPWMQKNGHDSIRYYDTEAGGNVVVATRGDQVKITHVNDRPVGTDASLGVEGKQGTATGVSDHHAAIEAAVKDVASKYPGVDVSTFRHEGELPDVVRQRIDPNAFYEGLNDAKYGKQYILSENVPNEQRAREVAVHEIVGHHGVDKITDAADWAGIQAHVLTKGGKLAEDIAQQYLGRGMGALDDAGARRVAREYVARVAENTNLDPTLWQNITASIRKALRAAGIRREWSDAEIRDLIRRSHENLKRGEESAPTSGIDPSLPRKLDTAADEETRGRGGLLGKAARTLETEFNVGKSPLITRAQEKGSGMANLLRNEAEPVVKSLIGATPSDKAALLRYEESARTPSDQSLLRSSAPKVADAYLKGEEVIGKGQDIFSKATNDPERKALLAETHGEYRATNYKAYNDPVAWQKDLQADPTLRTALADQMERDKVMGDASRSQIERAVDDYAAEIQNGGSPFAEGGSNSKVSRTLYMQKKDLTPQQWSFLEDFQRNAPLDVHEKGALLDIIRKEHLNMADRELVKTLSRQPKFGASASETLTAIANRKTLAPELKAFLGEYKDPAQRQAFTLQKVINNVRQAETINQLWELGRSKELDILTPEEHRAELASAKGERLAELKALRPLPQTPGFEKLAGTYVQRDVADALNAYNEKWTGGWLKSMSGMTSVIKTAMVPLNPASHARNWLQAPLMAIIARVAPWEFVAAAKVIRQKSGAYEEAVRNNIIGADFSSQDIQRGALQMDIAFNPTRGERTLAAAKAALRKVGEVYAMPDNLVRVAAYFKAKERFLKKGMTDTEAQDAATDFTNKWTMNYGQSSNIVKIGRETPFASPFLSYQENMLRILKNLGEDALHGKGEDRAWAIANLGGLIAAPLLLAQTGRARLNDKDRADWDRAQKLSPEYAKGQIRVPIGRNKDGSFRYMNIGNLVPAGDTAALARNLVTGDAKSALATNPFVGWDKTPVLNLISEQIAGRDSVTNQKFQTKLDRAKAIAQPFVPSLTPGIGYEAGRMQQAFTPNDQGGLGVMNPRTGRSDTPATALAGLLGVRASTVQPAALIRRAQSDAQEQVSSAKRELMQVNQTNATPAAKQRALLRYQDQVREIRAGLMRQLE